jgi:cytochrome c oxidase assembly protein subunit 15
MLGRMALLCVVLMLATISLSAFIRLSQAGLGCDDWPACYGQSLRALKQSVAVPEYGGNAVAVARLAHRIVASVALVLVITMVLAALAKAPVLRREGLLSLALLSLALALAGLGVATPGARLPVVAMSNLLGGFAMLALSWRLVAATASRTGAAPAGLGAMGVAALALLASQITLGALVSASYSALACTDLADCGRAAQATGWDWQALNPWREPVFDATTATVNPAGALLPLLHRLGAFVMSPLLALLAAAAWRRGRRRAGAALLALTATQVVLGLLIVATSLPLAVVLLHNLVAALLLATLVRAI